VPIMADHATVSHTSPGLTLTGCEGMAGDKGHPPRLCPMLKCAREAVNPALASFASISVSL